MGRYIGPKCRLCRREGIKLLLRGARCETAKCAMERQWRSYPPGVHNWRRGRGSEYGLRLREKQKVKRFYGLFERQFMKLFAEAERGKGNTGAALLSLLERRLDNVVFKLGFAPSREAARQTVAHGHVYVNGRRVNIPSFRTKPGDTIGIKDVDRSKKMIRARLEELGEPHVQNWLKLDMVKLEGQVLAVPTREDVTIPVDEQLIVELCSQ
ncbi:MAG: 30S ribosomal protein S4 [Phycisphaerae bacterium]